MTEINSTSRTASDRKSRAGHWRALFCILALGAACVASGVQGNAANATATIQSDTPQGGEDSGVTPSTPEGAISSSRPIRLAQSEGAAPISASGGASPTPPATAELEEVIVTAQKRSERLQDVPISISVLSGDELDSSTLQGVSEALNAVPGVATFPDSPGGGTEIIVRGVGTVAALYSGSSAIGYYLDSVPFSFVRQGFEPDSGMFDLDHVEVLRGPQGTLYGADSLNGIVRVITKAADLNDFDFKARTSLSSTYYGGENHDADFAVNIPIVDGKLAVRAVVGDAKDSGWINTPTASHVNTADLSNYRFKVNAQPTDDLSIRLSAAHSIADYGSTSTADGNRLFDFPGAQPYSLDYDAYGMTVNYQLPALTITSNTSYLLFSNPFLFQLSPSLTAPVAAYEDNTSRTVAEELLLNSRDTGDWRWSAGGFYRDEKDVSFAYLTGGPPVPGLWTFNDFTKSYAIFGEVGHRFFFDQLWWTLGARYFHDDVGNQNNAPDPIAGTSLALIGTTFSHTSPRAVITWKPDADAMLYASYSQGFRSGLLQNQFVFAVLPNAPAAKPDTLSNYEIGAKGDLLDHRVAYDISAYYMNWRDIQQVFDVFVPGTNDTETAAVISNSGSASGPGVDFGLTMRPIDRLNLNVNASWNGLEIRSPVYSEGARLLAVGDRPTLSPELTAGGSADYTFPLGGSGFKGVPAFGINYISPLASKFLAGTPLTSLTAPNQHTMLARANFTVEAPAHWTVMLYVDNLFNYQETPYTNPSNQDLSEDVRLRPRTVGIQVTYRYK